MRTDKIKITVVINFISCIALIVGTYAAFPNMHYIVSSARFAFFESIALCIEYLVFIITALLLLFYLKSKNSKLYKAISLIFLAGLVVGYAYYIILGFDSPDHKFDTDCITLLALPNLLALIFSILLVIPVSSKFINIARVSLASANVLIWLLLSLFQLSMTMSGGFLKFSEILSCLLFIGISLLFVVFAIIEGSKLIESNKE